MNGLLRIETFLKLFNIFQFETIFSTYEFLVDPLVQCKLSMKIVFNSQTGLIKDSFTPEK